MFKVSARRGCTISFELKLPQTSSALFWKALTKFYQARKKPITALINLPFVGIFEFLNFHNKFIIFMNSNNLTTVKIVFFPSKTFPVEFGGSTKNS